MEVYDHYIKVLSFGSTYCNVIFVRGRDASQYFIALLFTRPVSVLLVSDYHGIDLIGRAL